MAQPPAVIGQTFSDEERLEITFDSVNFPRLSEIGASFTALEKLYERRMGEGAHLNLAEVRSGSIIAVLEPVRMLLGSAMPFVGYVNDAVDFGRTLSDMVRYFSFGAPGAVPQSSDADEIREILAPVAKNGGGRLRLRSFRYADGKRKLDVQFDNDDIERAYKNAVNQSMALPSITQAVPLPPQQRWFTEETLIFDQTSRAPGKEAGRTGDRGIIALFSPKPLPVYFKKSVSGTKERMVLGSDNPMRFIYIVDGVVTVIDGEPISYTITGVHSALPLD